MARKKQAMKKRPGKEKRPLNKVDELKIEENWDDEKPDVSEPTLVSEWEEDWLFGDMAGDWDGDKELKNQPDFDEEDK